MSKREAALHCASAPPLAAPRSARPLCAAGHLQAVSCCSPHLVRAIFANVVDTQRHGGLICWFWGHSSPLCARPGYQAGPGGCQTSAASPRVALQAVRQLHRRARASGGEHAARARWRRCRRSELAPVQQEPAYAGQLLRGSGTLPHSHDTELAAGGGGRTGGHGTRRRHPLSPRKLPQIACTRAYTRFTGAVQR